MAKPRVTTTNQLANVIEGAELGRRSGLLAVERDVGTIIEEGLVYFISGRPVYAALGSLRGREALRALSSWAECRFAFDPDAPPPPPNVSAAVPSVEMPSRPQRVAPRQSSYPNTSGPGMSGYSQPNGYSSNSNGWQNGNDANSSLWNSGAVPSRDYAPSNGGYAQSNVDAFSNAAQQRELTRRPRRAPDVRDLMQVVTAYNLSRGHRTLLLLADGEHTIMDMVRLSSKSVEEVVQWLGELEQYGLIYYYA